MSRQRPRPTLMDRLGAHFDAYWWAWLAALCIMAFYLVSAS